jgi:hypothetical protein
MFRKLLIASAASIGFLAPLVAAPNAEAHEYRHENRHGHHGHAYRVYYHDPCRPGWICGGSFNGRRDAERSAAQFRKKGFQISIRQVVP